MPQNPCPLAEDETAILHAGQTKLKFLLARENFICSGFVMLMESEDSETAKK